MMPVRFHPEADAEMISAAKFYETQQKDLGKRFLASVQDAVNRVQVNPLLYKEIEDGVRRCLTTTFPFGVVFRIMPSQCVIVAVMHLHRHPGYWEKRLL
jgi:plasmid stabilization system protein ParE